MEKVTEIYRTKNFTVHPHPKPFVSREEGGHLRVYVLDESIQDCTMLSPKQAIEYIRLYSMMGEALQKGMNKRGVPVVKVNYHEMGNWAWKQNKKPVLHMHIFGRVLNAKYQPFPESVYLPDRASGFYGSFVPLNSEDIKAIKAEIAVLEKSEKYEKKKWGLEGFFVSNCTVRPTLI